MASFPIQNIIMNGELVLTVVLDLTIYPDRLTVTEFDLVMSLYRRVCPKDAWKFYKIIETPVWDSIDRPVQPTGIGITNQPYAFLDKVRDRIQAGRRVELRIWDRERLDSWSFHCYRLPRVGNEEEHSFYRIIMPNQTDSQLLLNLATELANGIEYLSGHGGYCFLYNAWKKSTAFDYIYKLARRYWAIDIEDLNLTLKLVRGGIKGVNWLTLVGSRFLGEGQVKANGRTLLDGHDIKEFTLTHGKLLVAGDHPVVGDRNRRSLDLQPYFQTAHTLFPVQLKYHPDFDGRFSEEGNTMEWFQRFVEPEGW
jgi:hypothetical protein